MRIAKSNKKSSWQWIIVFKQEMSQVINHLNQTKRERWEKWLICLAGRGISILQIVFFWLP